MYNLIKDGGIYQHYAITFSLEFDTREYREFDRISIYKNENEKKNINIGRIIFDFYDYDGSAETILHDPAIITNDVFNIPTRFSILFVDTYVIESVIVKLTDAISVDSEEIDSSELMHFSVNTVCEVNNCTYGSDPFFTTKNDFLTYTLKPLIKYIVNDVEYYDTYALPILYHRVLAYDKYFEVSDTFTNLLVAPTE